MEGELPCHDRIKSIAILSQGGTRTALVRLTQVSGHFVKDGLTQIFDCTHEDGYLMLQKAVCSVNLVIVQPEKKYEDWSALRRLENAPMVSTPLIYFHDFFSYDCWFHARRWYSPRIPPDKRANIVAEIFLQVQVEYFKYLKLAIRNEEVFRECFPSRYLCLPCRPQEYEIARADGAIFHKWNTSWCAKDHYIWFIDMRKIDEIPEIWAKWFSEQTMADLRFRLQKWQRFQDGFSEKLQSARKAFEEKSYHWVLKNN